MNHTSLPVVPTVGSVVSAVADAFPPEWAESWDRIGLLAGDPESRCERVLVTLDLTRSAVSRALALGANVIATHHPPFLDPPQRLTPSVAGPLFDALTAGVAVVVAHTNLDRAPSGATALPALLGLEGGAPLEQTALPMSSVMVYVPHDALAKVKSAMMAAGAGRIGRYDGCSFSVEGTGSFTPRDGSRPAIGSPGSPTSVNETRLEVVCPRSLAPSVIAAVRDAHPYEEPLVVVTDAVIARGDARMGRVCDLDQAMTLSEFAALAGRLACCAARVRGTHDHRVQRVAVVTGSAGSLVDSALSAGAEALVAGEVRYHDAASAVEAGLAIIELGHDASERPLVPVLAEAVRTTPGLDSANVIVDRPAPGYWTP
ncbi:MAG: Nif3-like dinuclear metal center hexameric protein [Clostridiales bacterium]|nr:Nif3-like dinuclear metal center hexameric protein [Clostridiales bacterium]